MPLGHGQLVASAGGAHGADLGQEEPLRDAGGPGGSSVSSNCFFFFIHPGNSPLEVGTHAPDDVFSIYVYIFGAREGPQKVRGSFWDVLVDCVPCLYLFSCIVSCFWVAGEDPPSLELSCFHDIRFEV